MEKGQEQSERFSIVKRAKSVTHAVRGIRVFIMSTHNAWVELLALAIAVAFGLFLGISYVDWMMLIFAAGLVLTAEAFNTAIEIDIDLTSPEYHPYARDTKDVAAGAVLIASISAVLIAIGIFGHYVLELVLHLLGR
ncbi:MAG: diacylglycerol kinase family protein [Candidatus Paceibacterota bacterium]